MGPSGAPTGGRGADVGDDSPCLRGIEPEQRCHLERTEVGGVESGVMREPEGHRFSGHDPVVIFVALGKLGDEQRSIGIAHRGFGAGSSANRSALVIHASS